MDSNSMLSDILSGVCFADRPIKMARPLLLKLAETKSIAPPACLSLQQQVSLFSHLSALFGHPSMTAMSQEQRTELTATWFQPTVIALDTRAVGLVRAVSDTCLVLLELVGVFRKYFYEDYFTSLSASLDRMGGSSMELAAPPPSSYKLSHQQQIALQHARTSADCAKQFAQVVLRALDVPAHCAVALKLILVTLSARSVAHPSELLLHAAENSPGNLLDALLAILKDSADNEPGAALFPVDQVRSSAQWCTAVAVSLLPIDAITIRIPDLLCCLKCCLSAHDWMPHKSPDRAAGLQALLCNLYALLPATVLQFLCFQSLASHEFRGSVAPFLRGLPLHPVLLTQPIADVMELLRHEEEHRSTSETYEWCQWVTREMHLNKEAAAAAAAAASSACVTPSSFGEMRVADQVHYARHLEQHRRRWCSLQAVQEDQIRNTALELTAANERTEHVLRELEEMQYQLKTERNATEKAELSGRESHERIVKTLRAAEHKLDRLEEDKELLNRQNSELLLQQQQQEWRKHRESALSVLVEAHEARILTLQEECSGWRSEASAQQLMGDSARMLANQLGKGADCEAKVAARLEESSKLQLQMFGDQAAEHLEMAHELQELRKRVSHLEASEAQHDSEMGKMMAEAQKEIDEARQQTTDAESQYSELMKRYRKLETEHQGLHAKLEGYFQEMC